MITTISSATALNAALKTAQSGDTIQLAAGQYDGLSLKNLSYAQDVTITSADLSHQAVLTHFDITNVNGLTVSNVQLDATGTIGIYQFQVKNSTDVHFDHVSVHGSLDGDPTNDANGILLKSSSNVSVTNSDFQQLGRSSVGVSFSSNVQLSGNTVHDIRTDGFDFAQVDHVTVSGNSFTGFHPIAGDHADAIQLFTTGTTAPSHDITISNNVVTVGSGTGAQGIFMRDLDGSLAFQNVTITGNLIAGGNDPNGIRVIYANGLTVSGNTVTTNVGTDQTRFEIDNANNVVSTNNQAVSMIFNNDTHLSETNDRLNNVMSDNGNTVLSNWLHAHGQDALYSSLQTAVSQVAVGVLGGPILATVTSASQQTLVGVQVMDPTATALTVSGANYTAIGNDLNDSINGNSGANLIYGLGGNDTIDGHGGADTLTGGAGDDAYIVPNNQAVIVELPGGGNDTVTVMGNYTLPTNVENLIINSSSTNNWSGTGNELNNKITGNGGANVLNGAAGADTIDGGAGNDTLVGGTGADVFRFAPGGGHDVITDFGAGGEHDVLDLSAFYGPGSAMPTLTETSAGVTVSFSTGDTILLQGQHIASLHATATGFMI